MTDENAEGSSKPAQFSNEELARIRESLTNGEPPVCPTCDVKMSHRDIGGGSFGLGYARKRDWLICGKCKRSAVFDIARGTRN
ncbi:MAG: hypothetical protein H0W63_00775 [Gemmatimonadaceae bacterium]|nr:hypothetical protein [Gemmatimonadaceae bacterium]